MFLYHQATTEAAEKAVKNGLKLTTKREMGGSQDIKKADAYLDRRRPAGLVAAGVRRSNNIYAFIGDETTLIDITDGREKPLASYEHPGYVLLRVEANADDCFVSDLDLYDAAKAAVAANDTAERLADRYWQRVIPLRKYKPGSIRRPEVMIPRDIPAERIARVS